MKLRNFLCFLALLLISVTTRLVSTQIETDILTVLFDDREWDLVHEMTRHPETVMEFVPKGESLESHTELYTVMAYYEIFKSVPLQKKFDDINSAYANNKAGKVQLEVLFDTNNIHMGTYIMPLSGSRGCEHTIYRLLKVNGNLYLISYMNKNLEDFEKKFKVFKDVIHSYSDKNFKM